MNTKNNHIIKLETENLWIVAGEEQILEHAVEGNQTLSRYLEVIVPDHWTAFGERALSYSLDKLRSSANETGWWSYLPIHKADNMLIGLCGYKGQPSEDGMVELGYEIMAAYQNNGLATEVAKALVANAFSIEKVTTIQAHTLGEINASTKVLTKCGFTKTEDVDGQELGTLWKWVLERTDYIGQTILPTN